MPLPGVEASFLPPSLRPLGAVRRRPQPQRPRRLGWAVMGREVLRLALNPAIPPLPTLGSECGPARGHLVTPSHTCLYIHTYTHRRARAFTHTPVPFLLLTRSAREAQPCRLCGTSKTATPPPLFFNLVHTSMRFSSEGYRGVHKRIRPSGLGSRQRCLLSGRHW